MKFYLMRHADAESGEEMDPTRKLTDTGWAQIPIMADFLDTQTNKIQLVMSSEFKRGKDTAEELAKQLNVKTLIEPALGPGGSPDLAWKAISREMKKLGDDDELVVVSHGPLINTLMAKLLLSGEGDKFHFSHGSIAHLDTETPPSAKNPGPQPCWLHWFVTAKLVLRLVEDDRKAVVEANRLASAALKIADACIELTGVSDSASS